jgi:hypothetical protein
VLYWLDVAAVLHDGGNFRESDQALDQAEQRLEALYTQSISKGAGTFFLNDTADDYRGDPHERSLLHVLRALNYAYAGQTDEAVVESRKVSAFLAGLGAAVGGKYAYRDDAFAQYLSALLFEDAGRRDDARISYNAAHAAYRSYAAAYGTQEPLYEAGAPAPGEGEIVFFHYVGVAPRRASETVQIAWNDALAAIQTTGSDDDNAQVKNAITAGLSANAITVAFPQHVQDPFAIARSEIEVAGRRAQTLLVEDISAIAKKALDDRMEIIRSRAIARAAIKYVLAKIAEDEVKKHAGLGWGFLAGLTARAAGAALEVADTRCWSTLPAQIRMARVRAPAGTQTVGVRYLSATGVFTQGEALTVQVKPGRRTYVHVRTAL